MSPEHGVKLGENGFPNMHLMEMHGFGREYIDTDGRGEIQMLCSECNTGKWHDLFDKRQANEVEALMAEQLDDNTFTLHPLYNIYMREEENFNIEKLKEWSQAEEEFREEQRQLEQLKNESYTLKHHLPYDKMYWEPRDPYIREEPKVGRNNPCPCGSGKKYKKCCINIKEEA
jgi:hypothetical protein